MQSGPQAVGSLAMPPERDEVDTMLAQWKRRRPELDGSGMAVVLRVQLLAGQFSARLKGILAEGGMAPFEYDVLAALRRVGGRGGLTPKQLCRTAQVTSGTMTNRIDRLEARGLVERRAGRTDDRRSISVVLTAKGAALVDGIIADRMVDALRCLDGLTGRERKQLANLLRAVSNGLEGPPES